MNRVVKMKKQFEKIVERYVKYMTANWQNRKLYYPAIN